MKHTWDPLLCACVTCGVFMKEVVERSGMIALREEDCPTPGCASVLYQRRKEAAEAFFRPLEDKILADLGWARAPK